MFPGVKSICFLTCLLGAAQAWAGIVVGGTRVIYDSGKKEASISVKNPEKSMPYLIQSWVENEATADAGKPPFLITPPLFRLDAGQENMLRIIRTGGQLPEDKESLFWLNIKSIPASEKTNNNQLLISVKTRIKLIYRPSGLQGNAAEAYQALTFRRQGNQLQVDNPTPYYVAFYNVKVGSLEIKEAGTVVPYGSRSWAIPAGATGAVSWRAINDYGGITPAATKSL
ncbi:molecular chaperone [Serratia rubidaea]|uniref:fimbrial biogenesis chaperone n=1 Tax=Serratia rubidaea TaxID=61652 RepID=UPI0022B89F18|nr:molecular chaperone [Serratia rubidaea]WBF46156.1 molecular chaperone [Serratia rubidaea]